MNSSKVTKTKVTKATKTKATKATKAKATKKYNIKRISGGEGEIWFDSDFPTKEEVNQYQDKKKLLDAQHKLFIKEQDRQQIRRAQEQQNKLNDEIDKFRIRQIIEKREAEERKAQELKAQERKAQELKAQELKSKSMSKSKSKSKSMSKSSNRINIVSRSRSRSRNRSSSNK